MADEDGLCLLVSPNGVRGVGEEDSRVEFMVRSRGRGERRRISFYSIYNIDQHVPRHVDSMRGFIEGILSNGRRRRILID